MALESAELNATLAAAAGDDPALFAELRAAFVDSLMRQVDLLGRARCDANWNVAALRLKGLAESFHAEALAAMAEEALEGAPGDPAVLRRMHALIQEYAGA